MAIYHFSAQIIGRKDGRSAVAASAYRSAQKMIDSTTGQICDYTKKGGVSHHEVMLPGGAPSEYSDAETLWVAVEKKENRKDAQLAREIDVALPTELDPKQQVALAQKFVSEVFVSKGMIAQLNVHDQDGHNPHFHVMLTTRDVTPDGFGNKNRSWNNKALLEEWRKLWADYANQALKEVGSKARIDHRSLVEQGIHKAPTQHRGPVVSDLIQKGKTSFVAEKQEIERLEQQDAINAVLSAEAEFMESVAAYEQMAKMLADAKAEAERLARQKAETERLERERKEQEKRQFQNKQTRLSEIEKLIEKEKKLIGIIPNGWFALKNKGQQTEEQLFKARKKLKSIQKKQGDAQAKLDAWHEKHWILSRFNLKTKHLAELEYQVELTDYHADQAENKLALVEFELVQILEQDKLAWRAKDNERKQLVAELEIEQEQLLKEILLHQPEPEHEQKQNYEPEPEKERYEYEAPGF